MKRRSLLRLGGVAAVGSLAGCPLFSNDPPELARDHGLNGYWGMPDGKYVFGAYNDSQYDLLTPDGQLTDAEGDIAAPEWLWGQERILAYRDRTVNRIEYLTRTVDLFERHCR